MLQIVSLLVSLPALALQLRSSLLCLSKGSRTLKNGRPSPQWPGPHLQFVGLLLNPGQCTGLALGIGSGLQLPVLTLPLAGLAL